MRESTSYDVNRRNGLIITTLCVFEVYMAHNKTVRANSPAVDKSIYRDR